MPPSIAEVHAALTAPGQMFEMEEVEIRGIPHPHVEARPAVAARRCSSRAAPTATHVPRVRGRVDSRFDGALPPRPPRSPTDSSTTSACARATVSPSRCATSPSGRSRSGRRPPPAPSSCRSTRGGRGPSSSTGSSDSGAEVVFVDEERRRAADRRSSDIARPRGRHRRPRPSGQRTGGAAVRGRAGRRRPRRGAARRSRSIPRTTRRSSTRRAPPACPRARSARIATSART